MTDYNDLSPFVSSQHVGDQVSPSTFIRIFLASLRTWNIVTLLSSVCLCCLRVIATCHGTITPFGDSLRNGCIGCVCLCKQTLQTKNRTQQSKYFFYSSVTASSVSRFWELWTLKTLMSRASVGRNYAIKKYLLAMVCDAIAFQSIVILKAN